MDSKSALTLGSMLNDTSSIEAIDWRPFYEQCVAWREGNKLGSLTGKK
jgi:hypothetical protein